MSDEKEIKPSLLNDKIDWKKYFNYSTIVKNIPFILFLSVIAILYIYNGHYADKLSRKIGETEKNVKVTASSLVKMDVIEKELFLKSSKQQKALFIKSQGLSSQ